MTPAELVDFRDEVLARHVVALAAVDQLSAAAEDVESINYQEDAYAEALFLRYFTSYESAVEKLFLHYVTGGLTLQGQRANSYLNVNDEVIARKITKAGNKFLSWAKPQEIRNTVENFIENGWPISAMMSAKAQELADCERVRNTIAHSSIEARSQFNTVQRNLLGTERLFPISPGQLLRIRNVRLRKLHIGHYLEVMSNTVVVIIDPPP